MNDLPITEIGAGGILAYLLIKECFKGVRSVLEWRNGRNGAKRQENRQSSAVGYQPASSSADCPFTCYADVRSALGENAKSLAAIGERLMGVHEDLGEIKDQIANVWKRCDNVQNRVTRLEAIAETSGRPSDRPKRS